MQPNESSGGVRPAPPPRRPDDTIPRDPRGPGAVARGGGSRRPSAVTALAVLLAVAAAVTLASGLDLLAGSDPVGGGIGEGGRDGAGDDTRAFDLLAGLLLLALAAGFAFSAWGVWNGQRWTYVATMVLAGVGALAALVALVRGEVFPALLGFALVGALAWLLFRQDVQAWLGAPRGMGGVTGRPT